MIDWTKSMHQTFEYYVVDDVSFFDRERLDHVTSSTVRRDLDTDTKHSFDATITDVINECYIRVYLVATQGQKTEKIPLGTFLCCVSSIDYNGKFTETKLEGYSSLIELKEKHPPVGTNIPKNTNIIARIISWLQEYARAPVIETSETCVCCRNYVAELGDSWFDYIDSILTDNGYFLNVDVLGRIFIDKNINPMYLQPKWEFSDDSESILCNEVSINQDIFEVPNAVEVIVSNNEGTDRVEVVNNSPDSPVSTVARGRKITKRVVNPQIENSDLNNYAKNELLSESTVETEISYSHGYCPVTIGDCIMLTYGKFGLDRLKLKIVSQSITCKTGCTVTETASSTVNLM